ncbi:MAG: SOS response-associated peptidase [Actinobacteria bacterium]|nr:SOS response-associated peptidase [Actinomycetota bacterium]
MCGRYVAALDPAALVAEFEVVSPPVESLLVDYNVAPTKRVYVVVDRHDSDIPGNALEVARWGLVPSWAKDKSMASRMINARVETVADKPSFRSAFGKRRCLIPANGYYEWSGSPKQPFYIHAADGAPLAMAGLYEWWRDPSVSEPDPASWLMTCTIITTAAKGEISRIHDRMPVLISRADRSGWLDHAIGGELALAGVKTPVSLAAYPVSTAVNKVSNNGPALILALPGIPAGPSEFQEVCSSLIPKPHQ